jgi:threonine dehydrogenase-like Zn-dependent dehydrogenase
LSLGAKAAGPDDAGFDTIFETSGAEAALGEAVSRAAHGATVVLIGLGGQATRVDTRLVVRHQLALRGSLIYDHPGDFAATLGSAHRVTGTHTAREVPLAEAPEAFQAARDVPGKTWIWVDG